MNGPEWLCTPQDLLEKIDVDVVTPEECRQEMRRKNVAHSLAVAQVDGSRIGQLINCEDFRSLHLLLRVTALVLKFVRLLRLKVQGESESVPTGTFNTLDDIDRARLYWIRESQSQLQQDSKFPLWKRQFGDFCLLLRRVVTTQDPPGYELYMGTSCTWVRVVSGYIPGYGMSGVWVRTSYASVACAYTRARAQHSQLQRSETVNA